MIDLQTHSSDSFSDLVKSYISRGASIALPGGSTPKLFLPLLKDVLENTHIIPTDERLVADDHPDSNYQFLKLYLGGCVHKISLSDQTIFPLDLAIVGMGTDGHIASLFPGYDYMKEQEGQNIVSVPAPTHIAPHVARTSLTLNALMQAKTCILVFAGQEKRDVWHKIVSQQTDEILPAALLLTRRDLIVCHINDEKNSNHHQ